MAESYASLLAAAQRNQADLDLGWTAIQTDPLGMFSHPAFIDKTSPNFAAIRDSLVRRMRRIGHGKNKMSPIADGATIVPTAFEYGFVDMLLTRFGFARSATDMAFFTDSIGQWDLQSLMIDFAKTLQNTWVDLVANLADTFGSPAGTSNVKMQVATFLLAKQLLEIANNEGPLLFFGHTKAVTDLQGDITTNTGGAIQWLPASAALIQQGPKPFKGKFLDVDIVQTSRCPTMNGGVDYASAMLAPNAIAYEIQPHLLQLPDRQFMIGPLLCDIERSGAQGETAFTVNASIGMTEFSDAAGQTIQSKA